MSFGKCLGTASGPTGVDSVAGDPAHAPLTAATHASAMTHIAEAWDAKVRIPRMYGVRGVANNLTPGIAHASASEHVRTVVRSHAAPHVLTANDAQRHISAPPHSSPAVALAMPFSSLKLHSSLLKAVKEMGFARPTPIQSDAIPPALSGRDVLACAMTGSGKTVAFLLPVLNNLLASPRRGTRALVITPTRELAAQILEELNHLTVHTPITAAAVYGGVGMGPQEHAFRSGVDVIVATPGRLLDHLKQPYAKLDRIEHLVLDEADRMLDMGFLPDIKRLLKFVPAKRQTLFFSATMPAPILELTREMLRDPATINLERKAAPAVGITQAVYPVNQELKSALLLTLLQRGLMKEALVFTRTKHRANRLWEYLTKHGIEAARIHGNRSQAQRTDALAGFKNGEYRVLVATDIAARGIDVEALGHVVNFDVPMQPEDYIHRVGRTARAEMTGEAFTFVSPDEMNDLKSIERAVAKALPRVTLPDFDYGAKPEGKLEVPLAERIAKLRTQRAGERARAKEKAERRTGGGTARPQASGSRSASAQRSPTERSAEEKRLAERRAPEQRDTAGAEGQTRRRKRRRGRGGPGGPGGRGQGGGGGGARSDGT
jgi:ATP-dependent RNA helicase RhlE